MSLIEIMQKIQEEREEAEAQRAAAEAEAAVPPVEPEAKRVWGGVEKPVPLEQRSPDIDTVEPDTVDIETVADPISDEAAPDSEPLELKPEDRDGRAAIDADATGQNPPPEAAVMDQLDLTRIELGTAPDLDAFEPNPEESGDLPDLPAGMPEGSLAAFPDLQQRVTEDADIRVQGSVSDGGPLEEFLNQKHPRATIQSKRELERLEALRNQGITAERPWNWPPFMTFPTAEEIRALKQPGVTPEMLDAFETQKQGMADEMEARAREISDWIFAVGSPKLNMEAQIARWERREEALRRRQASYDETHPEEIRKWKEKVEEWEIEVNKWEEEQKQTTSSSSTNNVNANGGVGPSSVAINVPHEGDVHLTDIEDPRKEAPAKKPGPKPVKPGPTAADLTEEDLYVDPHRGIKFALLLNPSPGAVNQLRSAPVALWGHDRLTTMDGGRLQVTDDEIRVKKVSMEAARLIVMEAKARGWETLEISGDNEFCNYVKRAAKEEGIGAILHRRGPTGLGFGIFARTELVMPAVPHVPRLNPQQPDPETQRRAETAPPEDRAAADKLDTERGARKSISGPVLPRPEPKSDQAARKRTAVQVENPLSPDPAGPVIEEKLPSPTPNL